MDCKICNNKYNEYLDPFIVIIDTNNFIEITYELCLNCLKSFKTCLNCSREFNEPWDVIYFNILNKTYYCQCCYGDKRNKHYKNCLLYYCINCSEKVKEIECKNIHKPFLPFTINKDKRKKMI
jgi:hypothetical protein